VAVEQPQEAIDATEAMDRGSVRMNEVRRRRILFLPLSILNSETLSLPYIIH
jgi:hypothetical protein